MLLVGVRGVEQRSALADALEGRTCEACAEGTCAATSSALVASTVVLGDDVFVFSYALDGTRPRADRVGTRFDDAATGAVAYGDRGVVLTWTTEEPSSEEPGVGATDIVVQYLER